MYSVDQNKLHQQPHDDISRENIHKYGYPIQKEHGFDTEYGENYHQGNDYPNLKSLRNHQQNKQLPAPPNPLETPRETNSSSRRKSSI